MNLMMFSVQHLIVAHVNIKMCLDLQRGYGKLLCGDHSFSRCINVEQTIWDKIDGLNTNKVYYVIHENLSPIHKEKIKQVSQIKDRVYNHLLGWFIWIPDIKLSNI